MTSSLVGSEMCIRDRLLEAPNDAAAGRRRPRSPPGTPVSEAGEQRHGPCCLLYTSDAADDM
eukprot:2116854-Prorocentrum_lima.AAC.1